MNHGLSVANTVVFPRNWVCVKRYPRGKNQQLRVALLFVHVPLVLG